MKLTGISKGAQEGTLLSTFEISSWLEGFINGLQNLLVLIQAGSNLLQFQSCWVLLNNLLQTGTSCNPWPYKPYVLYSYRAIVCCIHQFLVGKNSHFSRMPCKTVRIERVFFVCVKTKNTHTHPNLHKLHRNNSSLNRLQEGESKRKMDCWLPAACLSSQTP